MIVYSIAEDECMHVIRKLFSDAIRGIRFELPDDLYELIQTTDGDPRIGRRGALLLTCAHRGTRNAWRALSSFCIHNEYVEAFVVLMCLRFKVVPLPTYVTEGPIRAALSFSKKLRARIMNKGRSRDMSLMKDVAYVLQTTRHCGRQVARVCPVLCYWLRRDAEVVMDALFRGYAWYTPFDVHVSPCALSCCGVCVSKHRVMVTCKRVSRGVRVLSKRCIVSEKSVGLFHRVKCVLLASVGSDVFVEQVEYVDRALMSGYVVHIKYSMNALFESVVVLGDRDMTLNLRLLALYLKYDMGM